MTQESEKITPAKTESVKSRKKIFWLRDLEAQERGAPGSFDPERESVHRVRYKNRTGNGHQ